MRYIDLTHTFTKNMPVFPGDPEPTLEQVASLEKDSYNDHQLKSIMHVGTHMDAPFHMVKDGKYIDEFDPSKFFGKGIVLNARGKRTIDASLLNGKTIEKDAIVLLYTGYGEKYRTDDYFTDYPEITEDFAKKLVDYGVKIVGMDTLGPDHDQPWIAHTTFLGNDILILENLTNLDQLLTVPAFEIIALPAKLHTDAAPVRVIAKIV